jgi:hypothetical protein
MITKALVTLIGLVVGGWMIFDGVYVLKTGKYFGPEKPGLWSDIAAWFGLDPFSLGVPFIALGALWIVFLAAMLVQQSWAWYAALLTAILTLWYLPVGTILAVLYIVLLLIFRARLRT